MEIGNNEFKYKKDALNFYKKILNSYNFGEKLNESDKIEIIDLLKIHPNSKEKLEFGVAEVLIEKVKYNSKTFHILNNNSELISFSYIKCINGKKPHLTIFSNACRDVVQEDINKVKFQYFTDYSKKGEVKCQETGELCKWEKLVVDHRQPNTFSVIVDRFIELNNINAELIKYTEKIDGFYSFEDQEITENFREYHKQRANLRIVKKGKNSERAFQARVRQQKKDLRIR